MLKIEEELTEKNLKLNLIGRLDTATAIQLENYKNKIQDYDSLTLDFKQLEYISSSGLRALLILEKGKGNCDFKLINIADYVLEVLEMTGFSNILKIE